MIEWPIRIMLITNSHDFEEKVERFIATKNSQYTLAYQSPDAKEALICFPTQFPDIVFADARIPGIGGIELTTIVKNEHPKCVCVVLTDDQTAKEFVTFQKIIRAQCDDLLNIDITDEKLELAFRRYQNLISTRKERLLTQLFHSGKTHLSESIIVQTLPHYYAPVMLCTRRLTEQDINEICEQTNQYFPTVHIFAPPYQDNEKYPVLIKCVSPNEPKIRSSTERQIDLYILACITTRLGYTPYLLTMEPDRANFLHESLLVLRNAVYDTISIGNGRPMRISLPYQARESSCEFSNDDLTHYGNPVNLQELITALLEIPLSITEIYQHLGVIIARYEEKGYMTKEASVPLILQKLYRVITTSETSDFLNRQVSQLLNPYLKSPSEKVSDRMLFDRIDSYLRAHLKENITLNQLAEHFGISVSKLSKLFQKEIHDSVIHYFTAIRIEQAKKLLLGDAKIADAAYACGYVDSQYFSRVFHQMVGISPKQYKTANAGKK